jgi:hypothetical protein
MALLDAFGVRRITLDKERDRERATARVIEQEQRVQALDRAVEVIQRDLSEDRPHAAE